MKAPPNVIATLIRRHFNGLRGPPVVGTPNATHEGIRRSNSCATCSERDRWSPWLFKGTTNIQGGPSQNSATKRLSRVAHLFLPSSYMQRPCNHGINTGYVAHARVRLSRPTPQNRYRNVTERTGPPYSMAQRDQTSQIAGGVCFLHLEPILSGLTTCQHEMVHS
jgi:hypothetical protein